VPVIGQNPALPEAVSGPIAAVVPPPRPRSPVAVGDPIGRLLGADPIGSGLEPNKTILMAQRALQKVGYVVRPDGVMGATTRHALAQFERDRGLPVKGELSMRVRRELSTLSGLPVE
jgi:peptidoglycan hydrolase-like protein with peptidoglycan-binding domain